MLLAAAYLLLFPLKKKGCWRAPLFNRLAHFWRGFPTYSFLAWFSYLYILILVPELSSRRLAIKRVSANSALFEHNVDHTKRIVSFCSKL
jgi:hypothetical protein